MQKVDKRTELTSEALERLLQIAGTIAGSEQLKEREKLGVGIEALIGMYDQVKDLVVNLDELTIDRISALINNGIYRDKDSVLKEAVDLLFSHKKSEIMKKLESL